LHRNIALRGRPGELIARHEARRKQFYLQRIPLPTCIGSMANLPLDKEA
jgi:hypothetical protein